MPPDSLALHLIEQIYDAALEPALWPAFLEALSDALGATATSLVCHGVHSSDGAVMATVRLDPDCGRAYDEHYGAMDPWAGAARTRGVMSPVSLHVGDELVSHTELKKTEYYGDFARHFDVVRLLVAGLQVDGPLISSLSIIRPERAASFDVENRSLVAILLPHLRRALKLDRHIAGLALEKDGAEESLDRLPFAVVVLDSAGRVVFANQPAAAILARDDGLRVTARGITAAAAHETRALADLVRDAAHPHIEMARLPGGVMKVSRPSGREPFTLTVMRLHGHEQTRPGRTGCTVSLFIDDPDTSFEPSGDMLRAVYDLTRAEAAVACDVAAGLTPAEIARRQGVQPSTVRWHLKHVLAKTQARRQSDLVRLLARGPAALVQRES